MPFPPPPGPRPTISPLGLVDLADRFANDLAELKRTTDRIKIHEPLLRPGGVERSKHVATLRQRRATAYRDLLAVVHEIEQSDLIGDW